jgi:hypothetical protein
MARKPESVKGVTAPASRPTLLGLAWLSCAIALPVGAALGLAEIAWRWLAR